MKDPRYEVVYWVAHELKCPVRAPCLGDVPLYEVWDWVAFFEALNRARKRDAAGR